MFVSVLRRSVFGVVARCFRALRRDVVASKWTKSVAKGSASPPFFRGAGRRDVVRDDRRRRRVEPHAGRASRRLTTGNTDRHCTLAVPLGDSPRATSIVAACWPCLSATHHGQHRSSPHAGRASRRLTTGNTDRHCTLAVPLGDSPRATPIVAACWPCLWSRPPDPPTRRRSTPTVEATPSPGTMTPW